MHSTTRSRRTIAKGVAVVAGVFAILVGAFVNAPAAQAAPTVGVGPGTAIIIDDAGACSLTVAGHDRAGRLVGMTAGHCGDVGSRISLERHRGVGQIGRVVTKNAYLDYSIIALDAAKVRAVRSIGQGTISGVGAYPAAGGDVCKAGRTTGRTCGRVLNNERRYIDTQNYICAAPGDSGGPIMAGNRLVGILTGGEIFRIPLTDLEVVVECVTPQVPIHSPVFATKAEVVFADLNRRNVIGSGFRVA